jgi:predicted permease
MGDVLLILGPIFLLVALGAGLQRGGFFAAAMVPGLNRLCYWVALPGLIFGSLARGGPGAGGGFGIWEWELLGIMMGATVLVAVLGWVVASVMGIAWGARGTFAQAFFRGNLAFVGLPILLKVPGLDTTRVLLLLAPMMILYNVLAVAALVLSKHGGAGSGPGGVGRAMVQEWVRNPILWASVLGGAAYAKGWVLPEPLGETVALVGRMAVPLALVTIGAVLTSLPTGAWRGAAWVAMAGKVVVSPLVGWAAASALGIIGVERLVVLVALACPTAVASYTMAGVMGGDEAMAAQTVVGSTVASAGVLALILALAG